VALNETVASVPPRGTITDLTTRACRQLLDLRTFARVAVATGKYPKVFPVNYAVDGRCIVFRTVDGIAPRPLGPGVRIAFEVDAHNETAAWSVCVTGTARPVTDPGRIAHCDTLPLLRWIHADDSVYFEIEPHRITGRRLIRGSAVRPIRTSALRTATDLARPTPDLTADDIRELR
jgi:hypothetical protein